jgi:hypothetical protein
MPPMFVFIVANSFLPIIFGLNLLVTYKFLKVRRLSRHKSVKKPERLILGWWLGNISTIFAFTPIIWERTLFVQNRWWLISFGIAAAMSITGLLMMNSGLGQELRVLMRQKRRRK